MHANVTLNFDNRKSMRYKVKQTAEFAAERRDGMYLKNRWLGSLYTVIYEENNPNRPGVPAAARMEFTEGTAVGRINEYHLTYDVPGECKGMKRLAFLAVRVLVVCGWSCAVAVCAAVRHGVLDRWTKKRSPELEGSGLRAA